MMQSNNRFVGKGLRGQGHKHIKKCFLEAVSQHRVSVAGTVERIKKQVLKLDKSGL